MSSQDPPSPNDKNEKEPSDIVKKVIPPLMPMDWATMGKEAISSTPAIRYPSDVMEFTNDPDPVNNTDLMIVGTAGQKITHMGPDLCKLCNPHLSSLILRSHLIHKMEGISGFRHLELLELYDNQIEALEGLDCKEGDGCGAGETLNVLDMSYNVIRDMDPVKFCPNLTELYLANNKVKKITGLSHLSKLKKIDLGANRIRVMEGLSGLVNLEELWLGKNKIEVIDGIDKLTKLRRLDVQSNRLTKITNLATQKNTLEELYLASNAIDNEGASQPNGLALEFTSLTTLDLSKNKLTSTKPFSHLRPLEELWLSSNNIQTFEDVTFISVLSDTNGGMYNGLEGIYLEHNPLASDFEYRKRMAEIIPSLKTIDANMVGAVARYSGITSMGSVNRLGKGGIAAASSSGVETMEANMRKLQDMAIERAKVETEAHKKGQGMEE